MCIIELFALGIQCTLFRLKIKPNFIILFSLDIPVHENNSNKLYKERNKAHAANHNHRKQSDNKKSRGMIPFSTR